MRFILRTLGIWLLLLAMVAVVVDATKSLGGGGAWAVTPLGEQWRQLFPEMLEGFRQWVIGHTINPTIPIHIASRRCKPSTLEKRFPAPA